MTGIKLATVVVLLIAVLTMACANPTAPPPPSDCRALSGTVYTNNVCYWCIKNLHAVRDDKAKSWGGFDNGRGTDTRFSTDAGCGGRWYCVMTVPNGWPNGGQGCVQLAQNILLGR